MSMQKRALLLSALTVLGLASIGGASLTMLPGHAQTPGLADPASQPCPKCGGPMEAGYSRDYWTSNSYDPLTWSPAGEKQHLFSRGKTINISVYRCEKCGYLEEYAR
jgi:hypothetical protein